MHDEMQRHVIRLRVSVQGAVGRAVKQPQVLVVFATLHRLQEISQNVP